MHPIAKLIVGFIVPHSVVTIRDRLRARRLRLQRAERQAHASELHTRTQPYSYDASIEYLRQLKVSEPELLAGSIPETSLCFIAKQLQNAAPKEHPLRVLHVGNFVGVSLCYIAAACVRLHPESLVVAVDPNVRHRGIENPQKYVGKLLDHFGLQRNVLLVCGYSLSKNLADDGFALDFTDSDLEKRFLEEAASENVLPNIESLCGRAFDVAVMDGNHSADYLEAELRVVLRILKPQGYLVLDDVTSHWPQIQQVFSRLREARGRENSATDGRVGVLTAGLLTDEAS